MGYSRCRTEKGINWRELFRLFDSNQFKHLSVLIPTYGTIASHENGCVRVASSPPRPEQHAPPPHTAQQARQHKNSTMVSTKLLTTLSPSTILPKPRLRRSIPFGSSYANAYGYEKLSNDDVSKSLIGSINSYDSCSSSSSSSSGETRHDVPADDDSTVVWWPE